MIKRRVTTLLGAILGIATVLAQAEEATLRIANYGGHFTKSQNKYAAEIFTSRTGVKIEWIDGNPKDHLAKMIASRGREAPFDVVYLDDTVQAEAIEAGVLMKLDPKVVTNLEHIYSEARSVKGYGPGMVFYSVGLAYNVQAFHKAGIAEPDSWGDLWNPDLEGKVAIPDISTVGGIDFVIATSRLMGGDETDVSAAWDKLATLKPLYFFTSSSDLRTKILSGDVWAAPWYNGRAWGMVDEGFPLKFIYPKEKGFGHTTTIDVVKGTRHPEEAQAFLNFVLDPLPQLGQANEIPYGPTNKTLAPVLAAYPDLAKKFPSSPEDLKQLYVPDWSVVNPHYAEWVDRWNRQVAKQ